MPSLDGLLAIEYRQSKVLRADCRLRNSGYLPLRTTFGSGRSSMPSSVIAMRRLL